MEFGETIAYLRKERKLTQEALAGMFGSSQRHISQIENGEQQPGLPTIQAIADALQVPPWVLLYGQPDTALQLLQLLEGCSGEEQARLLLILAALRPVARGICGEKI